MIKAQIVADSLSPSGSRLTSFVLTMPRIVLAEFNTHRMFTRNSASSRAIKFEKMVEAVRNTPFIPIKWMKDHKGMQGTEYFTAEEVRSMNLEGRWSHAAADAISHAITLNERGVTKQICNRLLEPFMYHTVILTATEYDNYFALRAHPDAEIHIQDLAYKMLVSYNDSTPKQLEIGQWHIPFEDKIHDPKIWKILQEQFGDRIPGPGEVTDNPVPQHEYAKAFWDAKIKIATAMCAGVSYTVIGEDGKEEDFKKLITRHDKLSQSGHWSPFEHCARVMTQEEWDQFLPDGHPATGWCANFRGYVQYRKMFKGENKRDERIRRH